MTTERFTPEQVKLLQAKLDGAHVKTRQLSGRTLSYVEGYQAINEANRIFGFGSWSSSVDALTCVVSTKQNEFNYKGREKQGYLIAYIATVTVTVEFDIDSQSHTDVGYGEGIDYANVGQAHESAIKEAVTDAEKRALRHWGNPFGLALYDKEQREVERGNGKAPTQLFESESQSRGPAQKAPPANVDRTTGEIRDGNPFCQEHGVEWFKTEKMKSYAHPIKGTKNWCNKPSDKPQDAPKQAKSEAQPPHGSIHDEQTPRDRIEGYIRQLNMQPSQLRDWFIANLPELVSNGYIVPIDTWSPEQMEAAEAKLFDETQQRAFDDIPSEGNR